MRFRRERSSAEGKVGRRRRRRRRAAIERRDVWSGACTTDNCGLLTGQILSQGKVLLHKPFTHNVPYATINTHCDEVCIIEHIFGPNTRSC